MSVTRDHVEKGICLAWAVFLCTLVSGHREFKGLYNSLIISTSVIVPLLWGWLWILETYQFRWILGGAVMYMLCISVAVLVAEPFPEGLDLIREYPAKGLLILFNLLFLFRRKENWSWFMWGIAGGLLVALFLAYYNFFTPDAMNLTVNPTAERFPGSLSILEYHKNLFGVYLSFIVSLVFGFSVLRFHQKGFGVSDAWILLFIVVLSLPVVILTRSRSTQVSVVAGMALPLFCLTVKHGHWKKMFCCTGVALVLALPFFFVTDIGSSIRKRWTKPQVLTLTNRTNGIWPEYYEKALEKPLFGHGLHPEGFELDHTGHEHSTYLAHLTRTGFVGFGGFCIFLLLTFVTVVRRFLEDALTPELVLFLGFLAAFLSGVLLEGIVEPIRWPRLYLITLAGVIATGCLTVTKETPDELPRDPEQTSVK